MARYRGTVNGGRGGASRLGHAKGGLTVEAQSWQGKVVVTLYAVGNDDYVTVSLAAHNGIGVQRLIYDGPVGEFSNSVECPYKHTRSNP